MVDGVGSDDNLPGLVRKIFFFYSLLEWRRKWEITGEVMEKITTTFNLKWSGSKAK